MHRRPEDLVKPIFFKDIEMADSEIMDSICILSLGVELAFSS